MRSARVLSSHPKTPGAPPGGGAPGGTGQATAPWRGIDPASRLNDERVERCAASGLIEIGRPAGGCLRFDSRLDTSSVLVVLTAPSVSRWRMRAITSDPDPYPWKNAPDPRRWARVARHPVRIVFSFLCRLLLPHSRFLAQLSETPGTGSRS